MTTEPEMYKYITSLVNCIQIFTTTGIKLVNTKGISLTSMQFIVRYDKLETCDTHKSHDFDML